MKNMPRISDAEYEIMKAIWENEPLTAAEIVSIVDNETWNENTIRTMVNRLLKKGAIGYEKNGKAYIYHSLISSAEYKKFEGMSFLKKIYGGSISAMFASLVSEDDISKDELNDLKELLERELEDE